MIYVEGMKLWFEMFLCILGKVTGFALNWRGFMQNEEKNDG
jgi:hypothetical protein